MIDDRILVQKRYADLLTLRLNQCVVKSHNPYLANFRCGLCGDSQQNKRKKRGYIIEKSRGLRYYCHNCGYNVFLDTYLKEHQPDLYQQYLLDTMRKGEHSYQQPSKKVEDVPEVDYLKDLVKVIDLPRKHKCVQYVLQRQIPTEHLPRLYYTDRFYHYINKYVPEKFTLVSQENYEHGRLILPMKTLDGKTFGVIGRSLDPNEQMRYYTIKFDSNKDRTFGLEILDLRKHAYVVEGPIDSFFLPNCIAMAGTDSSLNGVFTDKRQYTIVLDNQPRNAEVISRYHKYISMGSSIVIWPNHITSKDINQMILDGISASQVLSIVQENTFSGLKATIKLNIWKKA